MAEVEPPVDAPKYIVEGFQKQDPELLEKLATYAEELAAEKSKQIEDQIEEDSVELNDPPEGWEREQWENTLSDTEAPKKACVTKKDINGREYYYYQWRDGDSIKSEYIAPVNPS